MKKRTLEGERQRWLVLASRLGRRLSYWLRYNHDDIPNQEWRDAFSLFSTAMRWLNADEMLRAKHEHVMRNRATDQAQRLALDELEREIRLEQVALMNDDELEAALAERKARHARMS